LDAIEDLQLSSRYTLGSLEPIRFGIRQFYGIQHLSQRRILAEWIEIFKTTPETETAMNCRNRNGVRTQRYKGISVSSIMAALSNTASIERRSLNPDYVSGALWFVKIFRVYFTGKRSKNTPKLNTNQSNHRQRTSSQNRIACKAESGWIGMHFALERPLFCCFQRQYQARNSPKPSFAGENYERRKKNPFAALSSIRFIQFNYIWNHRPESDGFLKHQHLP